jgi:hypothetical protein
MKNVMGVGDVITRHVNVLMMDGRVIGEGDVWRCVGMGLLLGVKNVTAHLDVVMIIAYANKTTHTTMRQGSVVIVGMGLLSIMRNVTGMTSIVRTRHANAWMDIH